MIKIIVYFIQSALIYLFFIIARVFGLKISRLIFSNIFLFLGPLFKSQKIIKKNLQNFSSKISVLEEKKLIKNMWRNYGKTFIEYIFLDKFRVSNSYVTLRGEENLNENIKNQPVIFISGHFANFELMSMEITKKNIPLAAIYRPLNNFFLNPFMEFLRQKYVCKNQIKKGINGVRKSIDYIKNKNCIALMIDQRVREGEKINFFNKPALTTTLPSQLSLKYNLNIIPVYIEREKNDNFLIEFYKPINPNNYRNKRELSLKLNKVLEKMVEKNPSQWIWTHNRWK